MNTLCILKITILLTSSNQVIANNCSFKDTLEVIYYIAFIILTGILVYYAFKTYKLESSRKYELLCKLVISERSTNDFFGIGVEVYNSGNLAAKNVELYVNEKYITKIDFVKPGDSTVYYIGEMIQTMNGVFPYHDFGIEEGKDLTIVLRVNKKSTVYLANTDILFNPAFKEAGTLAEIAREIDNVSHQIELLSHRIR